MEWEPPVPFEQPTNPEEGEKPEKTKKKSKAATFIASLTERLREPRPVEQTKEAEPALWKFWHELFAEKPEREQPVPERDEVAAEPVIPVEEIPRQRLSERLARSVERLRERFQQPPEPVTAVEAEPPIEPPVEPERSVAEPEPSRQEVVAPVVVPAERIIYVERKRRRDFVIGVAAGAIGVGLVERHKRKGLERRLTKKLTEQQHEISTTALHSQAVERANQMLERRVERLEHPSPVRPVVERRPVTVERLQPSQPEWTRAPEQHLTERVAMATAALGAAAVYREREVLIPPTINAPKEIEPPIIQEAAEPQPIPRVVEQRRPEAPLVTPESAPAAEANTPEQLKAGDYTSQLESAGGGQVGGGRAQPVTTPARQANQATTQLSAARAKAAAKDQAKDSQRVYWPWLLIVAGGLLVWLLTHLG